MHAVVGRKMSSMPRCDRHPNVHCACVSLLFVSARTQQHPTPVYPTGPSYPSEQVSDLPTTATLEERAEKSVIGPERMEEFVYYGTRIIEATDGEVGP